MTAKTGSRPPFSCPCFARSWKRRASSRSARVSSGDSSPRPWLRSADRRSFPVRRASGPWTNRGDRGPAKNIIWWAFPSRVVPALSSLPFSRLERNSSHLGESSSRPAARAAPAQRRDGVARSNRFRAGCSSCPATRRGTATLLLPIRSGKNCAPRCPAKPMRIGWRVTGAAASGPCVPRAPSRRSFRRGEHGRPRGKTRRTTSAVESPSSLEDLTAVFFQMGLTYSGKIRAWPLGFGPEGDRLLGTSHTRFSPGPFRRGHRARGSRPRALESLIARCREWPPPLSPRFSGELRNTRAIMRACGPCSRGPPEGRWLFRRGR